MIDVYVFYSVLLFLFAIQMTLIFLLSRKLDKTSIMLSKYRTKYGVDREIEVR